MSNHRHGVTLIETLVSLMLLATIFSAVAPLIARQARLQADARAYRLAVDELTNHLDRLTRLSPEEIEQQLNRLKPSEVASAALEGATFRGESSPCEIGTRITLTLLWPENDRGKPPVSLTGWIPAATKESEQEVRDE